MEHKKNDKIDEKKKVVKSTPKKKTTSNSKDTKVKSTNTKKQPKREVTSKKVEKEVSKKKIEKVDKKETKAKDKKPKVLSKVKGIKLPKIKKEKKVKKEKPVKKVEKKNKNKKPIKVLSIVKKVKLPKIKKEKKVKQEKPVKKTDKKSNKVLFTIKKIKLPKFNKKQEVVTKNSYKSKKAKNSKQSMFSKKTKKIFIITSAICLAIILLEGIYLIYNHYEQEKRTVYYDSFNSLVLDGSDIVATGSSNFKHSKFNKYTKGLEKAKITKYDYNGKILFEKMYSKGINTTFSSIITVSDGYIVVGSGEFSDEEHTTGAREAILIKYDKKGKLIWEKFYQVVTNTRFNKVIAVDDGYIAIGQSIYANMEMGNHTTGGGIIVKYDKDGNEVWHNNHGGMKSGNFNDIVEVNGDLYVVGKDATDFGNIVKYNAQGEYQWHKNYSYTDGIGFTGIAYMNDSLYVVGSKKVLPAGITDNDDRATTNTDALLVNYDMNGNIKFQKTFGGSNHERYNSILAYHNNLYVVGHVSSTDAGLKISTDGNLITGIVVRYDKDGNITKKECLGGKNNDNLTDIATDGVSIYASGYSNSDDGNISVRRDNGKDYFGKIIKLDFKFRTLMVK